MDEDIYARRTLCRAPFRSAPCSNTWIVIARSERRIKRSSSNPDWCKFPEFTFKVCKYNPATLFSLALLARHVTWFENCAAIALSYYPERIADSQSRRTLSGNSLYEFYGHVPRLGWRWGPRARLLKWAARRHAGERGGGNTNIMGRALVDGMGGMAALFSK